MTNDKPIHILARLEIGFRTDSARLQELENDLAAALDCARHFGRKYGSPDEWNTHWQKQWDNVEDILRRIRVLVNEIAGFMAKGDRDRIKRTLEAWETFLSEDAKLAAALIAIRTQASGLSAVVRKDWNILACTLDSHLETLNACAQALRIKLELLKKHSQEDVDQLIQTVLSRLPNRAYADALEAESYEQEYRKAAAELDQERHEFLGFMDVVKALLMWIETPEGRVRKNRSLKVDEAESCEFAAQPQ
jgi:hypothetical protein